MQGADACGDLDSAWEGLDKAKKLKDRSSTMAFERKGKGKVTFSHHQHDKAQTRFVAIKNHITYLMYGSGLKLFVEYQKACNLFLLSAIMDFNA